MTNLPTTNEPDVSPDRVPQLRSNFWQVTVGDESVVWSPSRAEPSALDPVSTVMLGVIDGAASIRELAEDVHEVVGIPLDAARDQVARVVKRFAEADILAPSGQEAVADDDGAIAAIASREIFLGPSTPCSENASRIGTADVHLRFGDRTLRVACDSRRATRRLRAALGDHLLAYGNDTPLGFVLFAPQGFQRHHRLLDRTGFVLSEARGLGSGLHCLASHLTALLPPAPGHVRLRARGIARGDATVVCVPPLLSHPAVTENDLNPRAWEMIDRLALDIDVETGLISTPAIPWPSLRDLGVARGHLGTSGARRVTSVIDVAVDGDLPPSPATTTARLAANALHGSPDDVLAATARLVGQAEHRTCAPYRKPLLDLLGGLS